MKNNTKAEKKLSPLTGAIIILIATILIILGCQSYRYPDMFRILRDESLSDSQTEELAQNILSNDDKNILVAYFSYSGTTKETAENIGEILDADLFEITPAEEYDNVYSRSNTEIRFNRHPEIRSTVSDMDKYNVIFVGYPVWWHATPAIINTFLESYDFSDKLIIPFCTSGGSDISETMPTFFNSCEGYAVYGAHTVTSMSDIEAWLDDLGFDVTDNSDTESAATDESSSVLDSTSSQDSSSEAEGLVSSADDNTPSESASAIESDTSVKSEEVSEAQESGKVLVAYFTWSGNTKEMAEYIALQTNGDILEITPAEPYPDDYNETGEIAKVERDESRRPAIANLPDSLDEYDTVFIGYPIWWHTAPMIIGTFLESYDLSNTDVYPFTQSASMDTEQFENSMEFVRQCAGGASVHDGLFTEYTNTSGIDEYLRNNGLIG